MAVRLAKRLLSESVLDSIILSDEIEISEIMVPDKMAGQSFIGIDIRKKRGLNIIAIVHHGKTITEIEPDYKFDKGDIVVVIGHRTNVAKFEEYLLI